MRKKRKGQLAGLWFVLPDLAGVCCFALLPMAEVIRRSFQSAVTSQWMGLKNYREVLGNTAFRLAAANTLKFTAVCIPLLVVCSLLLAVLLQRMKQAGKLLKSAFLLPVAVPAASVVLVWKTLFHSNGLLNGLLEGMGGEKVGWMTTGAAFWVLVFSYLWKNLGYTVVLWLAGILAVPREMLEAARLDGAGERQCFWKVLFPNLKGMLYTITVLSFLNSFKVFREAYLVAGSYPHESMYLLQHLFNNWFVNLDLDKMAAAAVCTGCVLLSVILLLGKIWDPDPGR